MGLYRVRNEPLRSTTRVWIEQFCLLFPVFVVISLGYTNYSHGLKIQNWTIDYDELVTNFITVCLLAFATAASYKEKARRQMGWMVVVSPQGLTRINDRNDERTIMREDIKGVFNLGRHGVAVLMKNGGTSHSLAQLYAQSEFFEELRSYGIVTGGRWKLALHNMPELAGLLGFLLAMIRIFMTPRPVEVVLLAIMIVVLLVLGSRRELKKEPWDETKTAQATVPICGLIALFVLGRVGYVFLKH
jgi:hypothetical protein